MPHYPESHFVKSTLTKVPSEMWNLLLHLDNDNPPGGDQVLGQKPLHKNHQTISEVFCSPEPLCVFSLVNFSFLRCYLAT